MIQLQRLEGFYRVAKAGGYARAVRDFSYPLTEPAVHQQVKKLEEELGQKLLRRIAKDRMVVTPAGEHLYTYCAPFFEGLARIVDEVKTGSVGGVLRIDAGPQEVRHFIPEWLNRFRRQRPQVRVELREVFGISAARLRRGEVDVIVEYWANPPRDVAQRAVARAYAFWVAPAEAMGARRFDENALADLPFVGFEPDSREYALQMRGLDFHGLSPRRLLTASTVDGILSFVQAGLGYSLIVWPSPKGPRLSGVAARRLRVAGSTFTITASWLRRASANPLLEAFLGAVPAPSGERRRA